MSVCFMNSLHPAHHTACFPTPVWYVALFDLDKMQCVLVFISATL